MGTFLESNQDLVPGDGNLGRGVDEVAKQMTRFDALISIADLACQKSIEAASHQRELKIAVDLHGHSTRQGIHVEEVDPVLDGVFNDHPLGITPNELASGTR